jgi:hypothetical protein
LSFDDTPADSQKLNNIPPLFLLIPYSFYGIEDTEDLIQALETRSSLERMLQKVAVKRGYAQQ